MAQFQGESLGRKVRVGELGAAAVGSRELTHAHTELVFGSPSPFPIVLDP